jgi:hypothetical protein
MTAFFDDPHLPAYASVSVLHLSPFTIRTAMNRKYSWDSNTKYDGGIQAESLRTQSLASSETHGNLLPPTLLFLPFGDDLRPYFQLMCAVTPDPVLIQPLIKHQVTDCKFRNSRRYSRVFSLWTTTSKNTGKEGGKASAHIISLKI